MLGDDVLVNHVHFDPHVEAPTHVHVEEQIVVVLEGEFEFWIDDESRTMRRGDVAVVPPWVPTRSADPRFELSGAGHLPTAAQPDARVARIRSGRRGLTTWISRWPADAAVVTGASKGLGRAIARELVAEGVDIAICARGGSELHQVADELRRSGTKVHAEVADVTRAEDIRSFITSAAHALGGIDILVNNAGGARPGTFESLTDDDIKADLDVKLFSQIRCAREALPALRRSDSPRIININAVQAKMPDPAFFATTVNRAACLNFSKALALELAPDGILVNSVNIGYVATAQWANIHARRAPELPQEEFFAQLAEKEVPLGRFGRDDEVSGLVAFLASDRASYLTGTSIDVAGGMGRYV